MASVSSTVSRIVENVPGWDLILNSVAQVPTADYSCDKLEAGVSCVRPPQSLVAQKLDWRCRPVSCPRTVSTTGPTYAHWVLR
jgi:hypothetical protein